MDNFTIIPYKGFPIKKGQTLNKEAITFWISTGFFAENDSFWNEVKWDRLNYNQQPWRYAPRDISLEQAVDEFAELFHMIIKESVGKKDVILALSGGLDSRTLAVALKNLDIQPYSYSYRFEDSFAETSFGKKIAKQLGWEFDAFEIPVGYLWDKIEEAGQINHYYAEFSHARQVAVIDNIKKKGDVWLLGHMGDVLFDDMGISDDLSNEGQFNYICTKVLKKGGKELANDLWDTWQLSGTFEEHLKNQLSRMLNRIEISNANARIRAFKSLYSVTRWTSTNLSYFYHHREISLPYYDDRMCRFIMGIPEKYLAARTIQIEYIKKYGGDLAKIAWQAKMPYNLHNYHKYKTLRHFPYRVFSKAQHIFNKKILGKKLILRNWENQFLGTENDKQLQKWLFDNPAFLKLVPKEISEKYYNLFKTNDHVYWSHPVSMLITLSLFAKENLG